MDAQRREDITEWDRREFSDGFEGLRRFADRGFSGAATDGTAWLFMFDGHVVGTVDADLEAFANASGTIYEAPNRVLPVLFAMQERGGEPRTQYYTNDTPLSAADRKLSQGGFTGYIELSENVLSGDYYVAYAAGESMAAAYVGNSRRLETGKDAFDLADDEVGIYTVYEVDLDVRELPTPDRAAEGGAGTASAERVADDEHTEDDPAGADAAPDTAGAGDAAGNGSDVTGDDSVATGGGAAVPEGGSDVAEEVSETADGVPDGNGITIDGSPSETATAAESDSDVDDRNGGIGTPDDGPINHESADDNSADDGPIDDGSVDDGPIEDPSPDEAIDGTDEAIDGTDEAVGGTDEAVDGADEQTAELDDPTASPVEQAEHDGRVSDRTGSNRPPVAADRSAPDDNADEDVFSEEAEWREAKSIPALDPSETGGRRAEGRNESAEVAGRNARSRGVDSDGNGAERSRSGDESDRPASPRSTERVGTNRTAVSQSGDTTGAEGRERLERLRSALEEVEAKRESLAAERDELASERDELERERDELERERDELREGLNDLETEHERLENEYGQVEDERDRLDATVEELRAEVERLREKLSAAEEQLPDGERNISRAEARGGTNLFIRYESKGGATLEDAHDGVADGEELRSNIRIERHTTFETEGLLVDGEPFEEFLTGTMEYRFTRWVVEDLPFEVSETDNRSALRDLYDALPGIDRAEIGGSVSTVTREAGEETSEERTFDLVLRDRMGNPLFVAELNDTRTPTAGGTLESLVANGGAIAEANDSFAGAFAVTASFFEPGALEAASDAVGGGLFGRSKRDSFVKLSRKRGYHLCLVESRDGGFHMTVPDL